MTASSLEATPGLGIIRLSGPDAAAFLHAQLTQNLRELDATTARPAAWLDPKGRVLACFDVVATAAGIDLVTATELIDSISRRLRLYVLRAKVTIETPDDCPIAALVGGDSGDSARGVALGTDAGARASAAGVEWFRVGAGLAYAYPAAGAAGDRATLAEIRLGRPLVGAATSGRFTAHMLNLDTLGAIAFDKGCYPGQEVVARTRSLGAARRRLYGFVAAADVVPAAGDAIGDAAGDEVGTVIRAARGDDGIELLAVVRTDAVNGPLALATPGSPLTRRPVPGEPAD